MDGRELLFDHLNDPYQLHDLGQAAERRAGLERCRSLMRDRMASLNDSFEASTWYRDHWTAGKRHIILPAIGDFTSSEHQSDRIS